MIEEYGRKYTMTILGITCTVGLSVVGIALSAFVPAISATVGAVLPVVIGAIAGMVATFVTGNAAVSFAYAKTDTTQASSSRAITDRRDAAAGVEPSP